MTTRRPPQTNEEIVKRVQEYMEKFPHASRNKIKIATDVNNTRLQELEDLGLIKLPPKIKPGAKSVGWRLNKT